MSAGAAHNSPVSAHRHTGAMTDRPKIELLTRAGCTICKKAYARLAELAGELDFDLTATDVDAAA